MCAAYTQLGNHLKKEFSMENLLFVTIMLQWQDYLIDNGFWDNYNSLKIEPKILFVGKRDQRLQLPNNVPISPTIIKLKKDFENLNSNLNSIILNHEDDKSQLQSQLQSRSQMQKIVNYNPFYKCFLSLYKDYIQTNHAPWEVNISGETRKKMKCYYILIVNKLKNNQSADSSIASVSSSLQLNDYHNHTINNNNNSGNNSNNNNSNNNNTNNTIVNGNNDGQIFGHLWNDLVYIADELSELIEYSMMRCPHFIVSK